MRANLCPVGRPREPDAGAGDPPLHGRVVRAGGGLRRRRLLAPVGAELLERPEHARPRGNPGVAARPRRRGSDRSRRRSLHGEPRAGRRLLRRLLGRGRRRGAPAIPRRALRCACSRPCPAGSPRAPRRSRRHLRPFSLRRRLRRGRTHCRDHPKRLPCAGARPEDLGPGPEARVLPGPADGPFCRDRSSTRATSCR